jgi:uncharacterized protein YbbC (DUF1343 family)
MKKTISFAVSLVVLSLASWTYHTTTILDNVNSALRGKGKTQSFFVLTDRTVDKTELENALKKSDLKYTHVVTIDDMVEINYPFWYNLMFITINLAIGLGIFSLTHKLLNKKSEPKHSR